MILRRGRHLIVSDDRPNTLDEPQHLVALASVEDNGLGADLTIVREAPYRQQQFPSSYPTWLQI